MKFAIKILMPTLILCAGALFGFFYTMSISIMPGLDLAAPYSAIIANQEIGHATQNYYFAAAMIGTPILTIIAAGHYYFSYHDIKISFLLIGTLAAWVAMLLVTLGLNVPLNQILDAAIITPDQPNLAQVWAAYSIDWQKYNWLRVLFSGVSLLCATLALKTNRSNF